MKANKTNLEKQQQCSTTYEKCKQFGLFLIITQLSTKVSALETKPPIPKLPIPTASQISWQLTEMAMFLHFGTNTFTDSEWGTGHVDPSVFNPTSLNATQWVSVAKDCGFSRVILTAKHHDGFCLWPSRFTDYSIIASQWLNGSGDVVADLAQAARVAGIQLGLYLSPWDRHDSTYGNTLEYNEYYMAQITELLSNSYGEIKEVWLDGAKGENEKDMEYFFDDWFSLIHQHQPGAVIFSDAGPDTRWVGDEAGVASPTCWSLFNTSDAKIGGTDPELAVKKRSLERNLTRFDVCFSILEIGSWFGPGLRYSGLGDPFGSDWVPPECDVSIRPGWFWHASEVPKSAMTLLDLYYKSVGRNCLFLLNVPPNSSGLISDEDIQVLQEFAKLRKAIFSNNLAKDSLLSASSTRGGKNYSQFSSQNVLKEGIYSYWAPEKLQSHWILYLEFEKPVVFNVLRIQEPVHMGQRIIEFHLDFLTEKMEWQRVISGTTVGYMRLLEFPKITCFNLRLVINKSRVEPLISYLGIFMDPFPRTGITSYERRSNRSHVLQQSAHHHFGGESV
ncbi:hypothetical protein Leryth_027094 [Lithospermum erythrorhizon]|nr:hypothetical protein Leryth_027094 [Lithospermum erythrorhizon]